MFLLRLGNGQHSAVGDKRQLTTISANPSRLAREFGIVEFPKFPELESPSFFLLVPLLDDAIERYSSKHRRVLTGSSDPSAASLTKWDGPGGFITSTPFFLSVPLDDALERKSSKHTRVLTGSSDSISKPLVSRGLFVDLLRTKNDFNG
jgi:hypothetical protein